MEKMTCPICGRKFDELDYELLENGNPVCPECAKAKESNKEEK